MPASMFACFLSTVNGRVRQALHGSPVLGIWRRSPGSSKHSLLTKPLEAAPRITIVTKSVHPLIQARLLGTDSSDGRTCYVMNLIPKHTSKYWIKGTL